MIYLDKNHSTTRLLTKEEYEYILRSQIVTLKKNLNKDMRGRHRKYLPYVFTEQGVSILSAILISDIAIEISIKIIDVFVNDLLKSARNIIILIDNYIDDSLLTLFLKYPNTNFMIITKSISKVANSGCETNFPRK